jgi:hypothetical protein
VYARCLQVDGVQVADCHVVCEGHAGEDEDRPGVCMFLEIRLRG